PACSPTGLHTSACTAPLRAGGPYGGCCSRPARFWRRRFCRWRCWPLPGSVGWTPTPRRGSPRGCWAPNSAFSPLPPSAEPDCPGGSRRSPWSCSSGSVCSSSASRSLRTDMVGLWRRAADRLRQRDPEHDALRRALRAAIVVPLAAAVSFALGGSQAPLFAIFGSVALLIVTDFPGNRSARALAYAGLGFNGAVLITLGTLVAPQVWVSVALMFVLGVAVTFSGVLSEIIAAGQRATLLTFVLPACTPVGPIPDRLLGWLIALALCVPAALFFLPPRHHDELRQHAAAVCQALAECLEGTATPRDVTRAMNVLWDHYIGADFRPVGLTAGSRALVRVVDDLGWLSDRVADDTGRLLGDMKAALVRVLRDSAEVLLTPNVAQRAASADDLSAALAELRTIAQGRYREDIVEILGETDDAAAVAVGRK